MTSVALVTIARDEERSIGRLIESAKNLVDEIILLDTGSRDRTVEIARAAGAKVHHFHWVDDFSAARNKALEKTTAPWRLILDADEWIAPETRDIRGICKGGGRFVGRINIKSRFHYNLAGHRDIAHSRTRISRLLPIGVGYAGVIHEQPVHNLPTRDVPIYAWHDGYEDAQLEKKGARNIKLLEKVIGLGGDDGYHRYQYAKELLREKRFKEAAVQLVIALESCVVTAPWREDLICIALNTFGNSSSFEAGLELIEAEGSRYSKSTDFWFCVGEFYMDLAQARPQIGVKVLELIESAFLRCIKAGESDEVKVAGRGSFLAAQNLYAFYIATDQPEKAKRFHGPRNLSRYEDKRVLT
jgi:glycosyltransferase involved in cell wall biosynthesis